MFYILFQEGWKKQGKLDTQFDFEHWDPSSMVCALHVLYLNLTLQLEINCIVCVCVCIHTHVVQLLSHVQLFATPWTVACQAPSVHWIFQVRILEWLPCPSPRDLPNPGIKTTSPALADRFFTTESPGKPLYMHIVFYSLFWASLVYSTKESTCNVRENDNPLQDSYLENPHGQRSLVGYSPWGRRVRHD